MRWSYDGPIDGMRCYQWNVPTDPGWDNNYLCMPYWFPSTYAFYNDFTDDSYTCVHITESTDPYFGNGNYFCRYEPKIYFRDSIGYMSVPLFDPTNTWAFTWSMAQAGDNPTGLLGAQQYGTYTDWLKQVSMRMGDSPLSSVRTFRFYNTYDVHFDYCNFVISVPLPLGDTTPGNGPSLICDGFEVKLEWGGDSSQFGK
eukprot:Phypoly_transcript_10738.p1 GENE.Phypoly_transcript_10738~~Phypoly_transcript_10738.p1  ORF type:complete len:199 (+),score=25.43 Phypoly_transcript_10738:673-1269(+)